MLIRLLLQRIPRPLLRTTASVALVAIGSATTAHAQPGVPAPGASPVAPPRGRGGPGGPPPNGAPRSGPSRGGASRGASFLLAHTGELQLTDAQVVRLAAIARRVEARRRADRARFDSARGTGLAGGARPIPGDSARRPAGPGGARQGLPSFRDAEQRREQDRVDLRDALGVLSVDQQATAWLLVSGPPSRGPGGFGGPGAPGGAGPRGGPGAPGAGGPGLGGPPAGAPDDAPVATAPPAPPPA